MRIMTEENFMYLLWYVLYVTDLTLTVSLPVDGAQPYVQRWAITSSPFITTSPTCLNVSYALLDGRSSTFSIYMRCIDIGGLYVEMQLYQSSSVLLAYDTIQLSAVLLNINDLASQYSQCAIVLEVQTQSNDNLISLNSIQLHSGQCQMTFQEDFGW
jgi:hypothetical protein